MLQEMGIVLMVMGEADGLDKDSCTMHGICTKFA
jgi:hypothetical protein